MTKLFNNWAKIILVSLTLSACAGQPIQTVPIPDFIFCGWLGPVGGADDACSCVHTLDTSIAPVHYGLNDCLGLLVGAIFLQGSLFNGMQSTIDTLCTDETNVCDYATQKMANDLKTMMTQMRKVNPGVPK